MVTRQHFGPYTNTDEERPLGDMERRRDAARSLESRPRLLDIVQASIYLGTSERYLRRLVQERRIPFVRLGGRKIRFAISDLDSWIEAQRVEARR